MKIAVEGCAHGELDKIYESIELLQKKEGIKVDLLICCGDFQSTRNLQDLRCMAVPLKYQDMCSFYKYFSGEKTAPILTIFVGGNHEASNYLQELPYGGWVAPNIYYLGYAGVINVAGVRIAGLSGIYKFHDFLKGHYEKPPYSEESKRSAYHIRNVEVFRLKQMQQPIDIFLSHDWPSGVYNHGNTAKLLKKKPYFADDMTTNRLGSKPCEELLYHLKPAYWFAAHLHVKFAAVIPHPEDDENKKTKTTKFLALDKCLPRRQFLQVLDISHDEGKPMNLEYDLEWLTILFITNHLTSIKKCSQFMPGEGHDSRWNFAPTEEEKELVRLRMDGDLTIPKNFTQTVAAYDPNNDASPQQSIASQPKAHVNPQTTEFCKHLGIDDPMALLLEGSNDEMDDSLGTPHRHTQSWSNRILISPERPGEISFVSTNEDEEISGDDQRCSSGGRGERSLSFSPPSLGRMSLPNPRNTDSTFEEESLLTTSISSIDGSETSLTPVQSGELKEDLMNDNIKEDTALKSGVTNRTMGPKKFKRRNESLYAEDEDDN